MSLCLPAGPVYLTEIGKSYALPVVLIVMAWPGIV